MVTDVLIVVIISQQIQILNHYVLRLKLVCCMPVIPQKKKKRAHHVPLNFNTPGLLSITKELSASLNS